MWEGDHEEFPGDVEMSGHIHDFEDNGVSMGGPTKSYRQNNNTRTYICCLLLALVAGAAALAYAYLPEFGLPKWAGKGDSSHKGTVSADSIVHNPNYDVALSVSVESVEGDVVVYKHQKTLTPVMSILPYDTEQDSVFAISYRTVPTNSHGAAHVLEHSVLSGSQKFPIKDPFMQLAKGSLQTFVNAMTANDLTSYICASRNEVDMKNLMTVYLDAVFQPLVVTKEGNWIFRQEGWRVEMNETGEPKFNGVVYSEMKGVLSSPEAVLEYYTQEQMFPNNTYRFNSGGDPKVIPLLTQEELTNFYNTFYHPSNAQVFVYGTKKTVENLLLQLDEYLQEYDPHPDIRDQSRIELQPVLDIQPKRHQVPYAADEQEEVHQLMMSWLISGDGEMDDEFQRKYRLAYIVLEELLMSEPNGILFKALQDSGLGSSVEGGIDQSLQQWTFDLHVSNILPGDLQAVGSVVIDALQKTVKEGLDKEDIESAMNTVEFSGRDISSATMPRGILLWHEIMDTWKYDLDPLTGFLSFKEDLDQLKQSVALHGSQFFTAIIEDYILNNKHSVIVDLYPDPTLAEKEGKDEQKRMVNLRQSQVFPALLDESAALAEIQVKEDPPELLASIPSVTVDDLAKTGYEFPILVDENRDNSGVTVIAHEVVSSFDIIYVDFGVDVSRLDFEDIPLLPLLAKLMLEAGTEKYSDVQISREIRMDTGGIASDHVFEPILSANTTGSFLVPDGEHIHTKLFMRGAAMKEKGDKLFELLSQIMFEANLDSSEHAISILKDQISGRERSLASGGMSFVSKRLQCRYSTYEAINEKVSGISTLPQLREALKAAQTDWMSFLSRLENMKAAILSSGRQGMILNLTGEKNVLKHVVPSTSRFLEQQLPPRRQEEPLPDFATEVHPWVAPAKKFIAEECPMRNEGIVSTGQVNFVGEGGQLYHPDEEIPGSMAVVTQFLEYNDFVLQIRERRGAYGAYATLNKWTGFLTFMSYRDPNLGETLEVYSEVPGYLDRQMKNAATAIPLMNSSIIGTIGSLDGSAPQPNTAGYESLLRWLTGSTEKLRQTWREQILKTNNNDYLEFAKRVRSWESSIAISGPKSVFEKEHGLNLTTIDVL